MVTEHRFLGYSVLTYLDGWWNGDSTKNLTRVETWTLGPNTLCTRRTEYWDYYVNTSSERRVETLGTEETRREESMCIFGIKDSLFSGDVLYFPSWRSLFPFTQSWRNLRLRVDPERRIGSRPYSLEWEPSLDRLLVSLKSRPDPMNRRGVTRRHCKDIVPLSPNSSTRLRWDLEFPVIHTTISGHLRKNDTENNSEVFWYDLSGDCVQCTVPSCDSTLLLGRICVGNGSTPNISLSSLLWLVVCFFYILTLTSVTTFPHQESRYSCVSSP